MDLRNRTILRVAVIVSLFGFSGQAMAYFISTDFVRSHLGDKSRRVPGVSKPPVLNPGFSEKFRSEDASAAIALADGKRLASFVTEPGVAGLRARDEDGKSAVQKRLANDKAAEKLASERSGYGLPVISDMAGNEHDASAPDSGAGGGFIPGVIPGTWVPGGYDQPGGGWGPVGGGAEEEVTGVHVATIRTWQDGRTEVMPEATPGVKVATVRTYADGHTEVLAGASPVPLPAPVFLLGAGLGALALLKRKQADRKLR